MRLDLRDYRVNIGHLNLYYDAGGMFDFEVNVGGIWPAIGVLQQLYRVNLAMVGRLAVTLHSPTYHLKLLERAHSIRQSTLVFQ